MAEVNLPPRSTEATLDEDWLVAWLEEEAQESQNFADNPRYNDDLRAECADEAKRIRALAAQLPDLLATRASLSAAEQENERLRTEIDKLYEDARRGINLLTQDFVRMSQRRDTAEAERDEARAQRDRKASEVEALASGKVRQMKDTEGDWWIADGVRESAHGAYAWYRRFATATEALAAYLGDGAKT